MNLMKLFKRDDRLRGWVAQPPGEDTPYHICEYQWFALFNKQPDKAHLYKGQVFYAAYYGWYVREGKAQFGNHVDPSVNWYQTFNEAADACEAYRNKRR